MSSDGKFHNLIDHILITQISYGEVQSVEVKQGRIKEQYRVEVPSRLAALEEFDAEVGY
jgi:hypothetical protein